MIDGVARRVTSDVNPVTLVGLPSPEGGGSRWRKWDLHIHTPASFHWNDGPNFWKMDAPHKAEALKRIIEKLNSSDAAVFGVMDYWTFDGYLEIRQFAENSPDLLKKRILPGIELRLEAPTDFRLNTHVLFSDAVKSETLTTFLHTLRCGGSINKPPIPATLVEIGRNYGDDKLMALGLKPVDRGDDEKMWLAGAMSAVITRESLREAIGQVGADQCLLIQPYDTSDGIEELDWKAHPYDDQELMRWAHIFEAKHPIHVALFLGQGHPTKPKVQEDFLHNLGGCAKPVVRGSDAHKVADYGNYPGGRITWLKADPTFNGLRQVCHEPAARCFIGERPPKLEKVANNPTKHIRSISVSRSPDAEPRERWFEGLQIHLNPGLIAIIGNKGSGKSALADIIALLGNTRSTKMEFLNDERFRKGNTRASLFTGTLVWEDGKSVSKTLDSNPDPEQPERVRYLPQSAIENLCNELAGDGPSTFENELKKVIFSHVPVEQQLAKESLDALIEYKTGPSKEKVRQLQAALSALNLQIVNLEKETSDEVVAGYRNSLALKKAELDAHLANEPKPPTAGPQQQDASANEVVTKLQSAKQELDKLVAKRDELKTERVELFAKDGKLENLAGKLTNLSATVGNFCNEVREAFAELGLDLDSIVTFKIDDSSVEKLREQCRKRIGEIAILLDGDNSNPGIESKIQEWSTAVRGLQDQLDAPQKAQQEFLQKKAEWDQRRLAIIGAADKPETKAFFEAKILASTESLPLELANLREERHKHVREIHVQLALQRSEYERLYKPVQEIATESLFTKKALKLDFAVFLSPAGFEENFLSLVNRQRIGPFQGDDEGRKAIRSRLARCDFSDVEQVLVLLDGILAAMQGDSPRGNGEKLAISSQLRKDVKIAEFYDLLYSLRYLEPRYTLRLDGKEISELSPGEKGALLLVFYLLLDMEEIPIIIDQPEQNLDNESVVRLLVDCIKKARDHRQVILVTHNPNLAIVCDADQIISAKIDKSNGNLITYESGSIENPKTNKRSIDVLEGTFPAFDNRRQKWMKPPPLVSI